jgi:hypothetical protein
MVIVTKNTQEVRNAIIRKNVNVSKVNKKDEYILIKPGEAFSVCDLEIDRALQALMADRERIKDMRYGYTIGDLVDNL